ncbi:MAG: hypothetical protein ACXVRJ_10395 [Gaiellaceae bacterium]
MRRVNVAAHELSKRAVVLALALTLAGCAGSPGPATTVSTPHIPHALGTSLAARADRIPTELRNGDGCAAAADAARLSAALDEAAASGAMPRRLQAPALTAVGQIESKIVCHPATTASATTNTTPANSCAALQARRQQLEQEKQALDVRKKEIDKLYKGKAAATRKHAIDVKRHELDQAEHALDQQLHGCH